MNLVAREVEAPASSSMEQGTGLELQALSLAFGGWKTILAVKLKDTAGNSADMAPVCRLLSLVGATGINHRGKQINVKLPM